MAKVINVLIVEGSKPEANMVLQRLFAVGILYEARRVEDKQSYLSAISEQCPDVILADISLPEFDGRIAHELATQLCPDVPFLYLADAATQKAHLLSIVHSDLEQFALAASHDLQEPLRTISLFSKLLSTKYGNALDKQADEYLAFIESAAQHMGALLEDLSIYTQLPVQPRNFEPVDLNEILRHTLNLFQAAIQENHAAVTSGKLPAVLGTGQHLGLVFQHLIDNALQYRGSDPPLVHVDAAKMKDHWIISVKDNGMGFPSQYAKQIFGLFKRLNKRDCKGTGLGLAICKRIVEVHGGEIWADSQQDLGSTFYFSIPRIGINGKDRCLR